MMKIRLFSYLFLFITSENGWLLAALCVVSGALGCAFICWRQTLRKLKARGDGGELFYIYVDKFGRVLKSCTAFCDNFNTFEVFDKLLFRDIAIEKRMRSNMPLAMSLTDKHGRESYLLFHVKSTAKGYKLTGERVSERLSALLAKVAPVEKLCGVYNTPKFYKDFDLIRTKLKNENGALVLFYLSDIYYYKSRLSCQHFQHIQKKIAAMLKKHFPEGEVYRMSAEYYCLVIAGTQDSGRLIEQLPDKMQKLYDEKKFALTSGIVSPEINAGVMILDEKTKNYTVSQAVQSCKLAAADAQKDKQYFTIYKPPLVKSNRHMLKIVREIVENDQIDVYFQPQLCTRTNRIAGFETLCRIIGDNSSKIKVHSFIMQCESEGYIIGLGEYIYKRAFEFAKSVEHYGISVSLNISPQQILEDDFVSRFLDTYTNFHLPDGSISIEITENFLVNSFDKVREKLDKLHSMGINIHLDDFGIGYSSMLYLKKLPINTIKIDREFVSDLDKNKFSRVICNKIIDIAHELSLNIIAEGVETEEQKQLLSSMRCNLIQGFLISRAVPGNEAKLLLEQYNSSNSNNSSSLFKAV